MQTPLPNRIAVYVTAAIALIGGLLPTLGNFDLESTAGIIAGLLVVLGVVREWLVNWGKWERGEGPGLMPGELEDDFDEESAEPIPDEVKAAAKEPEEKTYDPSPPMPQGLPPTKPG